MVAMSKKLLVLPILLFTLCVACEDEVEAPDTLTETGLYVDPASQTLADDVFFYQPRFVLWSDGADKKRYIQLPEGKTIDTSNPDHWKFPQGTKLWKEFWRENKRIETRLLWKAGSSESDWVMMAYVWDEAQTEAAKAPEGLENGQGTPHDVPDTGACQFCHANTPGRILSFSAVQLNHELEGLNLTQIQEMGWLSDPIDTSFELPGTKLDHDALGYLHANCGMCHNPNGNTNELEMDLWLKLDQLASVRETHTVQSTVNVRGTTNGGTWGLRLIRPGNPEESGIIVRMSRRGINKGQMPPVGSEITDDEAIQLISSWIATLTP